MTILATSDLMNLTGFNGFFSQEAYDYITHAQEINICDNVDVKDDEFWTDFMYDERDGSKIYAIAADAPVTSCSGTAIQVELEGEVLEQMKEYITKNELIAIC